MEKHIRGYNEGGAFDPLSQEILGAHLGSQDEATLNEIADGPKEPLTLEQRIKRAVGLLREARNSPLISATPKTFDTDFAKYKAQLKGILGGGVTARPSIWDMLSDLGAGVLD